MGKMGIIGVGNMGEALLKNLQGRGLFIQGVTDKDAERGRYIKRKYKIKIYKNNRELVGASDVCIFAVKPKDIDALLNELKDVVRAGHLFISILAGITTSQIEKYLGKAQIVRAMPNASLISGAGVTAICKGRHISERNFSMAKKIFEGMGTVVEVREPLMNAVTALSGSGPAYFAYFFGAMQEAAKKLGLERGVAGKLISGTLIGSGSLLKDRPFEEVIEMVTSRGGTTEAALRVLERRGFKTIVGEAIFAAERRAQELAPTPTC